MPRFALGDYETLLDRLAEAGYSCSLISHAAVASPYGQTIHLRHDIDLHLRGVEVMAHLENRRNVHATYYVPLSLHFNVLYPENRAILCEIRRCGHEIGLHYDLTTYPSDPAAARHQLTREIGTLESVLGCAIRTICMHNPHTGYRDPFLDCSDYVNPDSSTFRQGCLYVSDSCRSWRDESLLTCFGEAPPRRVLLNTHPELWQDGSISDPMEYIDKVLRHAGVQQHLEYFDYVRGVWAARAAREPQSTPVREDAAKERDG